jgi:hypothetical protein
MQKPRDYDEKAVAKKFGIGIGSRGTFSRDFVDCIGVPAYWGLYFSI